MRTRPTHWLRLAALAALFLLLAAPAALRAQTTVVGTIRSGGLVREYRLYVPSICPSTRAPPERCRCC